MPKKGHKHGWTSTKTKKHFKDCQEAQEAIDAARQPDAAPVAKTEPYYSANPGQVTVKENADGTWTASTPVKWSVKQSQSTMTLPDWSWDKMTPADKAAVADFEDAIRVHEEGHMTVAEQYTKDHPTTDVEGNGATRPKALDDLERNRAQALEDYKNAANARSDEYDAATDHGANQSAGPSKKDAVGNKFPGGKDAHLNCP